MKRNFRFSKFSRGNRFSRANRANMYEWPFMDNNSLFKNSTLIKTGDIINVCLYMPNSRKITKKVFKKYQLKAKLEGAQKKYIKFKTFKRQRFLRSFARNRKLVFKYWKPLTFISKIVFLKFKLRSRSITSFFKLKKVMVSLTSIPPATNFIGVSQIKNTGRTVRRKSLKHLILAFNKKMHRLNPIRRTHRKKRRSR